MSWWGVGKPHFCLCRKFCVSLFSVVVVEADPSLANLCKIFTPFFNWARIMPFIDDNFTMTIRGNSKSGPKKLPVINPATEDVCGVAPECTALQLDDAVIAARIAFPTWSNSPLVIRRSYLQKIAKALNVNQEYFIETLIAEHGMCRSAARFEISSALSYLKQFSDICTEADLSQFNDTSGTIAHFRRNPLGVVAVMTSW